MRKKRASGVRVEVFRQDEFAHKVVRHVIQLATLKEARAYAREQVSVGAAVACVHGDRCYFKKGKA